MGDMSDLEVTCLQDYERYLHSERQLSAHTVHNYLYELNRVSTLLPKDVTLLNVGREHWQQVLAKLHRKGLSLARFPCVYLRSNSGVSFYCGKG